jgi:hypothetical protein
MTIYTSQLGDVPLPDGISRDVFEAVAKVMVKVVEVEGTWHGQIVALIPDASALDQYSTCLLMTNAAKGIVSAKMSYLVGGSAFEGELVDIMDWDGAIMVTGSDGIIVGVKRQLKCDATACPVEMAGNFGKAHGIYLFILSETFTLTILMIFRYQTWLREGIRIRTTMCRDCAL